MNSMELIPSSLADRCSASLETPCILWNPEAHRCIYVCLPPSHMNPVPVLHPTSWRPILIFRHLCVGLRSCLSPWGFPHNNPLFTCPVSHVYYMPHPCRCVGVRELLRRGHSNVVTFVDDISSFSPLKPNDLKKHRTAHLTSRCCILYIYSTNIRIEYFKHAA